MHVTAGRGVLLAVLLAAGWLAAVGMTHTSAAKTLRSARLLSVAANVTKADATIGMSVEVVTGDPRSPCSGSVSHDGHRRRLTKLVTSDTGGAQWSWRIPKAVPSGRWTIRVACRVRDGLRHATEKILADRGSGPGRRAALFATHSFHAGTFDVAANDDAGGSGAAGSGGSLYPVGQCTWWVARKRPDLPYFPRQSGDARNWGTSARAAGFPVDGTPQVGDVAVFQPGQQGAGKAGHVAYVVKVDGNTIDVSEAHFGDNHPGTERPIAWRGAALQYIHHMPSTSTTTTTETTPPGATATTAPQTGQTQPTTPTTTTTTMTTPTPERVTHYQCDATATSAGHTVESGQHWGTPFTTTGTEITNGSFYIAAQDDKADHTPHRATIGIYTDGTLSAALATVEVTVPIGGSGVEFTFPHPVVVDYQEHLWAAVVAEDRVTAYDVDQSATNPGDPDGCFIGRIEGTKPPTFAETAVPQSSVPTFQDTRSATGSGPSISPSQTVEVFCKVYDPTIPSASPGGYWYKIASSPWSGHFYATANAFLNGDPTYGPYANSTDIAVTDC